MIKHHQISDTVELRSPKVTDRNLKYFGAAVNFKRTPIVAARSFSGQDGDNHPEKFNSWMV
jgi:hypothetical protein